MPHVFWVCPLRSSTCTKTSAKPQFHKLTPKSNQGASKGHATSEESIRQATLMTFIKCRNRGVHSSIDWKGCSKTNVPPHTATRRHKSIDLAKSRNYNIYIYIYSGLKEESFYTEPCLAARQFASLTEGLAVSPPAAHSHLLDVPRFTMQKLEHLSPSKITLLFFTVFKIQAIATLSKFWMNIYNFI